ncbi:MAG: phosphotransferase, partial [Myxococcota bacterium]|nr:phosphotransferase [Myxococcota bacterium]
ERGICTPRLIPTTSGLPYYLDAEGACWRALTWVPGESHQRLTEPDQAAAAARFVARWHRGLEDLQHKFVHVRVGVHDTSAHMSRLANTLVTGFEHRLFEQVEHLGSEILGSWANWEGPQDLPLRVAHGDLKVSNVRFNHDGEAIALVDLDTLGRMSIDAELGDAWRSWCNRATEDKVAADFDLTFFQAAATAYLEENPLPSHERLALPAGIERIALELAARFTVDAIDESYFGWSDQVAPTRGEHNLLRARGQLSLARDVRAAREEMDAIVR